MSNTYLKITIENNWRTRNIEFLNLKSFCCNLKITGLGAKLYVVLLYFYFERNYDVLKSKNACFLLNKSINFNKTRRNRKWKTSHTVLERWALCFSSYKNCELKVKLWWVGACERKKEYIFGAFILIEGIFLTFVFYLNIYCMNVDTFTYQKHCFIQFCCLFFKSWKVFSVSLSFHRHPCSSLITNRFETIIIEDSTAAALNRHRRVWTKFLEPLKV